MLTIGNLAKAVGLNPATIRYYEEMGVIPRPRRSESGYRLYSEVDVHRLGFIQRAKLLSLSLNEIKEMVAFAVDGRCVVLQSELMALLECKLADTRQKISELKQLEEELNQYCDNLEARVSTVHEVEPSPEFCDCLSEAKVSAR